MFGLGFNELLLILIIVVVVFGATRLPKLGDGLGRAIASFKRGVAAQDQIDGAKKDDRAADDVGTEKK